MKKLAVILACAGLILPVAGCAEEPGTAPPPVGLPSPASTVPGAEPSSAPRSVAGPGPVAASKSPSLGRPTSPDPGVDPVFATDPVLKQAQTYTYRHTEPGDHSLPAGTFTLRYNVATATTSPLKTRLEAARDSIAKASGIAVYLDGGTALNDADLTAIQSLRPAKANRLYIYNLRSLQGGTECTPTSGLACAGQQARGGRWPYLWYNGWWDSWVRHLTLDDLVEVKAGAFSNTPFESVSLQAARTIGAMAFGHRPYAKQSVLYYPAPPTSARTPSAATSIWSR